MDKSKDLIGEVFGKLTVVEASEKRSSNGSILYRCSCECGGETYTTARYLKSGHTKSCGCTRKEKFAKHAESLKHDLKNKKIGRLTVIKEVGKDKHRNIIWECKCNCGNVIPVLAQSLVSGNTTSCGCITKEKIEEESKKNSVDGTNVAIIKNILKNDRSNITLSRTKGIGWDNKRSKWRAYIMFKRKSYHLGYFVDLSDAIEVRKEAEQRLFGEFLEWYNSIRNKK